MLGTGNLEIRRLGTGNWGTGEIGTEMSLMFQYPNSQFPISQLPSPQFPISQLPNIQNVIRRRPLIADLFHRIGYVEKMGTGLKRIKEECRKHNTKFKIETNGYFIISFELKTTQKTPQIPPQKTPQIHLTGLELKVIKLIGNDNRVSMADIAKKLSISKDTVKEYFARLKKRRIIKRVGPDRGGYWEIRKK